MHSKPLQGWMLTAASRSLSENTGLVEQNHCRAKKAAIRMLSRCSIMRAQRLQHHFVSVLWTSNDPPPRFGRFNPRAQRATMCLPVCTRAVDSVPGTLHWGLLLLHAGTARLQQSCFHNESLSAASPPPGWGTSAKEKQRANNCSAQSNAFAMVLFTKIPPPCLMHMPLPGREERWVDCHTASSKPERPMLGFVDICSKWKAKPFLLVCMLIHGTKTQQRYRSSSSCRDWGGSISTLGLNTFHTATCLPHACMPVVWHCKCSAVFLQSSRTFHMLKWGCLGFFCWKGNSKDLGNFHQHIKFPGSNVCPLGEEVISAGNSSSIEL